MLICECIDRATIVQSLAEILSEWEEAAEGKPLEFVYGSIGLLLDDICHALNIDVEELQSQLVR